MKSWAYWRDVFGDLQHQFALQIEAWDEIYTRSEEEQEKLLEQYDTLASLACEYAAKTGQWPKLPKEAIYCIAKRIDAAHDLALKLYLLFGQKKESAIIRPPNLATTSEADILHWFLVDWWQKASPKALQEWRNQMYSEYRKKDLPTLDLGLYRTCRHETLFLNTSSQKGVEYASFAL